MNYLIEQMKAIGWAKIYAVLISKKEQIIGFSLLILIIAFLLSYFEPRYLFLNTITTGGDTASHYYTAKYLKEVLLPHGNIIGWEQGNYAGFALFQFYFPLPFVIMVLLSLVMPLQIAFKLVTILGVLLLPPLTYFSLRLLRYGFPIPVFGALFTLPFLFMEANSMWGGNIPSTLAGEFAYSLGLSLSILFIGSFYNGIVSEKHVIKNAVLIALTGFAHGYTLLFAGVASLFFLITTEDFLRKFKYLFKVHVLGFMLMGVWIIPLLANLSYTTRYNFVWVINSIFEVFPVILIPFIVVAVLGRVVDIVFVFMKKGSFLRSKEAWGRIWDGLDIRIYYLWFCVISSGVFYLIAYKIHVVDIRYLPLLQVFLMIIAAVELGRVVQVLRVRWLFTVALAIMVFLWVEHNTVSIKSWIIWNYTGFEAKPQWPEFSSLNKYIAGTASDPRVVYEHSGAHNSIGSVRAFESIPLFSGRSTLEGLYMQSSISSPFVFYIQSEVSKEISCPLPDYGCSTLDLKNGIRHLKMFNVKDFIVRSDEVKSEIKRHAEFVLKKRFGPYEVYELTTNENRYVTPLRYEPVFYETENWKSISYRWFKNNNINDVHLVFARKIEAGDLKRFKIVIKEGELDRLPKMPIDKSCNVKEEIKEEEIFIKTDCINKPLLIKISYHPNWKVEGADKVYLVSPSFMLIFPDRENVRLRFSKTRMEYAGAFLSIMGFFIFTLNLPLFRESRTRKGLSKLVDDAYGLTIGILTRNEYYRNIFNYVHGNRLKILISTLVALILLASTFILSSQRGDANILYTRGIEYLNEQKYIEARDLFETIIKASPDTSTAVNASYSYAITYFKQDNFQKTIEAFQRLIKNYPESTWVPEAYYHIALSFARLNDIKKAKEIYQFVTDKYPASNWAQHSRARLIELGEGQGKAHEDVNYLYRKAMKHFDAGEYPVARGLFSRIKQEHPKTKPAEYAMYFNAICFFKEQQFRDVIKEFESFIKNYPGSDIVAEAYYHIGVSYQRLKDNLMAKRTFERIISDFPDSRWAKFSLERLNEETMTRKAL